MNIAVEKPVEADPSAPVAGPARAGRPDVEAGGRPEPACPSPSQNGLPAPASPAQYQSNLVELSLLWRRWTKVVELFGRRRRARRRIGSVEFQVLRGNLLAVCRALAECKAEDKRITTNPQNKNGEWLSRLNTEITDEAIHGLEELVRPWLTPQALERTNSEVLFDLWSKSHGYKEKLCPPTLTETLRPWAIAAALGGALGLIFAVVVWIAKSGLPAFIDRVNDLGRTVRLASRNVSPAQWLAIAIVLMTVMAFVVVWRSARR
jgi:hypothetical protein